MMSKYKKFILGMMMTMIMLFTSAYSQPSVEEAVKKVKPVEVQSVEKEKTSVLLSYIGTVSADEMKQISFKSGGKIKDIYVEKGKKVQKGDKLAELDITDLNFEKDAAKAQYEAAKANYQKALNGVQQEELNVAKLNVKKAEDDYTFSKQYYDKMKILLEEGAVSQHDFDQVKLDLDIKYSSLEQSKENYKQLLDGARVEDKEALASQVEMAKVDYEHKTNQIREAILYADIEGSVIDVLQEKGELVDVGNPVIVVGSDKTIVNVGVAKKDVGKIELGDKVQVSDDGIKTTGAVTNIGEIPDEKTRTYTVEITLDKNIFKVGWIVTADIYIGEETGIWIPVTSILSNEHDYVFVCNGNQVEKRQIEIENVKGTNAKVSGLKPKEKLVIKGMKRLVDKDVIEIQ